MTGTVLKKPVSQLFDGDGYVFLQDYLQDVRTQNPDLLLQPYFSEHRDQNLMVVLTQDVTMNAAIVVTGLNVTIVGAASCAAGRADGADASMPCTITAATEQRHFVVSDGSLQLASLALVGGNGTYGSVPAGGSVLLKDDTSTLRATQCVFQNNVATIYGGAVASLNPAPDSLEFTDCTFTNNTQFLPPGGFDLTLFSSAGGSAVFSNGGVSLLRCLFTGNVAQVNGAVASVLGVSAVGSIFSTNTAALGGAVAVAPRLFKIASQPQDCPGGDFCEDLNSHPPGAVTLTGSLFANNSAVRDGGAVYTPEGSLAANNCTFISNAATEGGAASIAGGALTLTNSTLQQNAASRGGAVASTSGTAVALSDLVCSGNAADTLGGCVLAQDASSFTLSGSSTMDGNAAAQGGAVAVTCTEAPCDLTAVISGATLVENVASMQGGALYVLGGGISLSNCTLRGNSAAGPSAQAGAVFVTEADGLPLASPAVALTDVLFDSNAVAVSVSASPPGSVLPAPVGAGYGGALMLSAVNAQGAAVVLTRGALRDNTAVDGAGLLLFGNVSLSVTNTTFSANIASGIGGGLCLRTAGAANATLLGAVFSGNAAQTGGAVAMSAGVGLTAAASAFSGNSATNGAAFFLAVAGSTLPLPTLVLSSSTVSGNVASLAGGFAYTDATSAAAVAAPSCAPSVNCVGNAALNGADVLVAVPLTYNATASSALVSQSGALVPEFNVSLFDCLGTRVLEAPRFSVTVFTNVSAAGVRGLRGATTVAYGGGSARFRLLSITDEPGTVYGLTFVLTAPDLPALDGQSGSVSVTVAPCAAVTQVLDPVSSTCVCSAGFFLEAASAACEQCANGAHSSTSGALSCTLNTPGYASSADRTAQVPCAAGSFLNASTLACQQCANGTYANTPGAVACTLNSPGYRSSPDWTAQLPCPAGSFLDGSSLACAQCPNGTYASTPGSSSCTPNSPGYLTSPDRTAQLPCAAGTFLNASTLACEQCANGAYASTPGAVACTLNSPGYRSSPDRTAQLPCPAGSFLNGSSLACEQCELGTYTAVIAQVACRINPAGSVSVPQTTFAAALTVAGLNASSFGPAQNATLTASIAASLNVSVSTVSIGAVADAPASPSGRRLQAAASSLSVNFTVATTGTDTTVATSVRAALGSSAAFGARLAAALAASNDTVLAALPPSALLVSAVAETTVFLDSESCADGTFLNGVTKSCEACPRGLVSKSDHTGCLACPARMAWVNSALCVPCPDNSVTAPNDPGQCACEFGYYDTRFGASLAAPACAACPRGGVCVTGLVGAAQGYWRNSTVSDVFYKCREGNCLEEVVPGPLASVAAANATARRLLGVAGPAVARWDAPTNCQPGNTGPICGICAPGFALQSGQCLPCDPADAWAAWSQDSKAGLLVGCAVFGIVFLSFAFFQPLVPALERSATAIVEGGSAAVERGVGGVKHCFRCCCCCFYRHKAADEDAETHTAADVHAHAHGHGAKHETAAPAEEGTRRDSLTEHAMALAAAPAEDASPKHGGEAALAKGNLRRHTTRHLARESMTEHSLAANAAFAAGNVIALATDVDGGIEEDDNEEEEVGGVERQTDMMDRLEELMLQIKKTSKIFIKCGGVCFWLPAFARLLTQPASHSFFQIVSTFLKSLDVPWPRARCAATHL